MRDCGNLRRILMLMRIPVATAVLMFGSVIAARPAMAQGPRVQALRRIQPGTGIRLHTTEAGMVTGTLGCRDSGVVFVGGPLASRHFATAAIDSIWTYDDSARGILTVGGALLGAVGTLYI